MYNTGREVRPSKPLITSHRHAQQEFSHWIKENDLQTIVDRTGLIWQLELLVMLKPSSVDLHAGVWELRFIVTCSATAEDLVRTGTFRPDQDQRLIDLLEEDQVLLALRPRQKQAHSLEDARSMIVDQVESLRAQMLNSDIEASKRALVARHIDRKFAFSHGRPGSPHLSGKR